MGNYFGSDMENSLKKNQYFIMEINKIKMERKLQMKKQMRDREIALEIAKARELFLWFGAFYIGSITWTIVKYKYNRKLTFSPLIPLTFIIAYQADSLYGSKKLRIIKEAEHIMEFERDLLALPHGVPTVASIDVGRMQNRERKRPSNL